MQTSSSLKSNNESCEAEDDPKHVCTHCGEGFFKKSDLKEHIVAVHRNLKTHICDQCRKGFTTPSYLRLHVLTVHEGVKAYSCPLCSKRYTQKHSLKKHISSRHGSDSTKNTATSNKEPHQSVNDISSPVRIIATADASQAVAQCNVYSAALKKSFSPLPHCIFLYNTRFLQLLLSLIKLKNIICDLLGTDPVPLLTISSFPL
ncbi:PR domain zinc finger protein [Echinococcus granulosus]|uniref:PR domain zinc finger protein n=1 Tax=Echinococcus granulosus TaxID=6210 RepID=W6UNX8_ECHGR|nr:PR domain zinc finger protein [Echinococcus granulosus]EUB63385.1 PR domain zinc finger protein [Echinococcus granulosus]